MDIVLAHGEEVAGGGTSMVTTAGFVAAMVTPFVVLGVVAWFFWKAKRREDEALRRLDEWRNVPSS